jgi:hypothetical protein
MMFEQPRVMLSESAAIDRFGGSAPADQSPPLRFTALMEQFADEAQTSADKLPNGLLHASQSHEGVHKMEGSYYVEWER